MEILVFILAIIAAFYAGHKYSKLLAKIEELRESLAKKADKKEPQYTSNTSNVVIDPFDEIQKSKFAHDEVMRKLNPND